jgi:mycoredoxin
MVSPDKAIVMYCRKGCEDSELARSVLVAAGVPFREVDIDEDPAGLAFVRAVNGGYESTPTILFPTGATLVEPSEEELLGALEASGLLNASERR